jgi:hypothetical protein
MAVTVDIRDNVTAAMKRFEQNIAPTHINTVIGAAEVRLFQNWFLSMPQNKRGWPSTGFWADAARATNYRVIADDVWISVNKLGVRQRYQGGEIHPTEGKYLTIPARSEAYGKRAREFDNLRLAFHRVAGTVEAYALVVAEAQEVSIGRKRKAGSRKVEGGGTVGDAVMFWLVKSVRQAADPDVLPPDNLIEATAIETINDAVDRAMRRGGDK